MIKSLWHLHKKGKNQNSFILICDLSQILEVPMDLYSNLTTVLIWSYFHYHTLSFYFTLVSLLIKEKLICKNYSSLTVSWTFFFALNGGVFNYLVLLVVEVILLLLLWLFNCTLEHWNKSWKLKNNKLMYRTNVLCY